jgi:hypothetical protein
LTRQTINERLHLRLWLTPLRFQDKPVWIGQISRAIGVRFTLRTWNLTTHKIDPDVDDARDYVLDDLMESGHERPRDGRAGHGDPGVRGTFLVPLAPPSSASRPARLQTGVVFHMMACLSERGRVGLTAVGDSHEEADRIYESALAALQEEAEASLQEGELPAL